MRGITGNTMWHSPTLTEKSTRSHLVSSKGVLLTSSAIAQILVSHGPISVSGIAWDHSVPMLWSSGADQVDMVASGNDNKEVEYLKTLVSQVSVARCFCRVGAGPLGSTSHSLSRLSLPAASLPHRHALEPFNMMSLLLTFSSCRTRSSSSRTRQLRPSRPSCRMPNPP